MKSAMPAIECGAMRRLMIALLFAAATSASAATYTLIRHIAIGGAGGWDYVAVDAAARRVYQSHSDRVAVVDIDKGTVAGTIMNTQGVHGVALAPDLNRGFVSAGRTDSVTVFDLKTLATVAEWKTTGANPDAILYEPGTKRLFTFNGRGKNATVFDATTGTVVATIDLCGKPEFSVTDGTRVFVNIEDTSEIAIIDPKKAVVEKRGPLAPCVEPSGLALDRKHRRLFSVCSNETMVATDADSLKVVGSAPIGKGVDGVAFDNDRAFSSNGADGTITVVHEIEPDKFEVEETVPTARGARTIAADPKSHHLFLPTAQFGPPVEGQRRPPIVEGTFELLEVGK
jgi:DNA-binding beta-propeller fold protein YncE